MTRPNRPGFSTRCIHAGQSPDPTTGAVMMPIYATSTYVQQSPGVHKGYEYARSQNPTRMAFERCVADLESGSAGFAFASGLAAIATILECLDQNAHVIATDDIYGGTRRLFTRVRNRTAGLSTSYVDLSDLAAIEQAIRPETKMIWVETPTNPLLKIADLTRIAEIAKRHKLIAVADNTFASPYLQRPIEHGFDIAVHSTTKYLNGHSDMVGGIAVVGNNPELRERLGFLQNAVGGIQGPFDSFLALRGIKTLALRMERQSASAAEDRGMAGEASENHPRDLSGAEKPSAACAREIADARLRRHDFGRTQDRSRRRARLPGTHRIVRARRKPRCRRKPDRASRSHDAWLGAAGGAGASSASMTG